MKIQNPVRKQTIDTRGISPKKRTYKEFPGGLVVRIPGFHQGTEIPQAGQRGQKKTRIEYKHLLFDQY